MSAFRDDRAALLERRRSSPFASSKQRPMKQALESVPHWHFAIQSTEIAFDVSDGDCKVIP